MKKLFLFLSISFSLQAQSDSLKVTFSEEKVEKFEKTTLIDEYEKAFGGNRVVKSALRFRLVNENEFAVGSPSFQYEKKIGKSVSIIGNAKFFTSKHDNLNFGIEGRYYLNKNKLIPNINGRFISIFGSTLFSPNYLYTSIGRYSSDTLSAIHNVKRAFKENYIVGLKYGTQFGNISEIGINTGFKFGNESEVNTKNLLVLNTRSSLTPFLSISSQMGIGLLFPKMRNVSQKKCEFLNCNYKKTSVLKMDLYNLTYLDKFTQNLRIGGAYERKLGNTPISLNTSLQYNFNATNHFAIKSVKDTLVDMSEYKRLSASQNKTTIPYKEVKYENINVKNVKSEIIASAQLRYYVGQGNRLKNELISNNLNGLYLGLEYFRTYENLIFKDRNLKSIKAARNSSNLGFVYGYQTFAKKNVFVDYSGFMGYSVYNSSFNQISTSNFNGLIVNISIKLGLAK